MRRTRHRVVLQAQLFVGVLFIRVSFQRRLQSLHADNSTRITKNFSSAREIRSTGGTKGYRKEVMYSPETHPSLIARLQADRNERAWTEFVSAYDPFLRRLIERQGVPPRHVADVAQQVFAAIARSVEQWRDDGQPASFRRWVSRVARNAVIKFMTRERRQIGGLGGTDLMELLDNVPDTLDDPAAQRYELELIIWAAEQVRGEFRETSWRAFQATVIDQRQVADVAAELGVTPGSIYMSRSRIMARIREKIREVTEG